MDLSGLLWAYICLPGLRWASLGFYGPLWVSLGLSGLRCVSPGLSGHLLPSLAFPGSRGNLPKQPTHTHKKHTDTVHKLPRTRLHPESNLPSNRHTPITNMPKHSTSYRRLDFAPKRREEWAHGSLYIMSRGWGAMVHYI